MDALPLPPRPNLDYYKVLARQLRAAAEHGTVRDWTAKWLENLAKLAPIEPFGERDIPRERLIDGVERLWRRFVDERPSLKADIASIQLPDAQLFLARLHGFASWPDFADHVQAMTQAGSTPEIFESAVDAIVGGDIGALRSLLDDHPDLVHARSTREHHSTLLHYVSANGVEDFRQVTPPNIVSIAGLLLDRGAAVNAESEAYGGHSTTLGLASTSIHPEQAGVQIPLLELLLARGADIEQRGQAGNGHTAVLGCLANGQGKAARFLAERGAGLDLESAAGVGRVDVLERYFDERGRLTKGATPVQLEQALMYATGYGHDQAVRFLLAHGADPNARNSQGQTPLHWTTYGPHVEIAAQLLAAGASVEARDNRWNATALDWALDEWVNNWGPAERERGYALVERLMAAGARSNLDLFDEGVRSALLGDARMAALLKAAER